MFIISLIAYKHQGIERFRLDIVGEIQGGSPLQPRLIAINLSEVQNQLTMGGVAHLPYVPWFFSSNFRCGTPLMCDIPNKF